MDPTPATTAPDRLEGNDSGGTPAVELLPVALLDVDPCNPRKDPGDVTDLATSVAAAGVRQPLQVRPDGAGRYGVVCGSRRLAAALLAGLDAVPCIVRDLTDDDALFYGGLENLARSSMNPIEEANLYRELLARNPELTQYDLAARLGVSQPKVAQRLKLLELDVDIQELVAAGEMSIAAAYRLAKSERGALPAPRRRPHTIGEDDIPSRSARVPLTITVPAGHHAFLLPTVALTVVNGCARAAGQTPDEWVIAAIKAAAKAQLARTAPKRAKGADR